VEYYIWTGFFAPKGIPPSVLKVLREGTREAVNSAEFKKGMNNIQSPITYLDADEFRSFWEKDTKRLNEIVRLIGKIQ
jgi:tripartite-type tricarboxylate transporter receptor subunit TctC